MKIKKMIGLVSAVFLTGFPLGASAQVVVSGSASHYDGDSATPGNTISDFTVTAGNNRKLVVAVNYEDGDSATNVTYAGQSFTIAADTAASRAAQIWYLDAPPVGTSDVVVQFSGGARSLMGVVSLQNAAPGFSVANAITGAGAWTNSITTTEADTFVIGCYTENNSVAITGPFATQLYMGNSGSSVSQAGYTSEAVAGVKTYVWSHAETTGGSAVAGFTVAPPSTTLAVDFGGDYRDGNQNADSTLVYETGDYDLDGMADDRRGYRTIDSVFLTPITVEAGKEAGVEGKSKNIYAGYQVANLNVLTDPPVSPNYKYAGSAADQLVAFSGAGTTRMSHVFTPHVKKENFLSGLSDNAYILSFEDAADSVSFDLDQLLLGGTARVLVQNGSDWYVSDTGLTATGSLSVNGYTETWHPYDPSVSQFLDASSLGAGVSGSTLTDIQAVGVLAQKLDFDGTVANASRFGIGAITANMEQSLPPSSIAIDFGGDYNDDNQKNTDALTVGLGDYDFGANAVDDYAARREITDAFITINNVNGLTNKTTVFFSGAQYVNFDNSVTAPVVTQNNYKWRGLSDTLQITFDANATANSGMAFAPYVKKADFLNGFDSVTETFGFEDAADSVSFAVGGEAGMARALVLNGSDWYVSDTSQASGSLSVNGYTETWHPYDPVSNLFLDEGNLGSGVAGSTLTDIQAAGVLMQRMNFDATANSTFTFSSLTLKVVKTVIPTVDQAVTDDFNRADTAWSSNGADIRSDWTVSGTNVWRINGNRLEVDLPDSVNGSSILYNSSIQLANGGGESFALSADVTATTNDQWCGVVFNYQNPSNYYMLRIKTGTTSYQIIPVIDGANGADLELFSDALVTWAAGTAYTLAVSSASAYGYTFEITEAGSSTVLNPNTSVSFATSHHDGGYAGLWALSVNLGVETVPNCTFDNFDLTVSKLESSQTFAGWMNGYSVSGQTAMTDDYDGDGMDNLTEYALGGNPELSDAGAILPLAAVDSENNLFIYVYNRRTDAETRGLSYTLETDTSLFADAWTTSGVTEAGTGYAPAGFESVTNTVAADLDARFLRLQIGLTE